jgi:hypothetical protein
MSHHPDQHNGLHHPVIKAHDGPQIFGPAAPSATRWGLPPQTGTGRLSGSADPLRKEGPVHQ